MRNMSETTGADNFCEETKAHIKIGKKCLHRNPVRHTIRKVKFLSKNSILIKPQHFHEFFHQIFFGNFSREIKAVNS